MRKSVLALAGLAVGAMLPWASAEPVIFSDYRTQKPGVIHHIKVGDLPAPDQIAGIVANGAFPTSRPAGAMPHALPGFSVTLYAQGLHMARELRTAPNGDIFLAESDGGDVRVFRGVDAAGRADQTGIFAGDLPRVYGMAFYPPGPKPEWLYVSTPTSVFRYRYHSGDLKATGERQLMISLPGNGRGHWTRDLAFSQDGRKLYVAVGSNGNVTDIDSTKVEQLRADVLEYNPDGTGRRVYVSGVRNAGGGLAVHPVSGELWGSVNERDGLGDNLVPDYITHFQEGGFYGWPYFYMGNHPDPVFHGKHPELGSAALVPDVLIQPHNASLEMVFYQGEQFPKEYHGDIFSAQHGSWNRSVRTGYEVIRIPMHGKTRATGEYEDFLTGFVTPEGRVWGRPVGVTVAPDGALLVSDDMSNSIWRVVWTGK